MDKAIELIRDADFIELSSIIENVQRRIFGSKVCLSALKPLTSFQQGFRFSVFFFKKTKKEKNFWK